jgi:hypothetical protein
MSHEQFLLRKSKNWMLNTYNQQILSLETSKGCSSVIADHPIDLEPAFHDLTSSNQIPAIDIPIPIGDLQVGSAVRTLSAQMSPKHQLDWIRAERFLKQLSSLSNPFTFEIVGNQEALEFRFKVSPRDESILSTVFEAEYWDSTLKPVHRHWINRNLVFTEFLPPPPYHHLLTLPSELQFSPFQVLLRGLSQLPPDQTGFFQVIIKPATHNWHHNVELLTDLEFLSRSLSTQRFNSTYQQQTPSSDMKQMSINLDQKAHSDKPFFFVVARVGLTNTQGIISKNALNSFTALFRHGGKPLWELSHQVYNDQLGEVKTFEMVKHGLTYRNGFLLNSAELSNLIHIPSINVFKTDFREIPVLDILPVDPFQDLPAEGITLGSGERKGKRVRIALRVQDRAKNVHIIGKPGTGKSTLLENMILSDIKSGKGLAFIDPHGDAMKRILASIPEEHIDRCVYLDFGDPDWIPIWNPLKSVLESGALRTVDDLVSGIRSTVQEHSWGDRLEHLLRHGFYGLKKHGEASFLDLLTLFDQSSGRKPSDKKVKLVNRILSKITNPTAKLFWTRDFPTYKREELASSHHKLSKLLMASTTISLMLSQRHNLLDMEEIMRAGKILLLDLSNTGDDARKVLGKFLLSSLFHTALYRSKLSPNKRLLFSVYCDEAHKLTTHTLGDILVESRKFGISLILAHQYLNQFPRDQIDALSSAGTSVLFNIDIQDATHLSKDLSGKATPEDIINLRTGEAILKMDTQVLKIVTDEPLRVPEQGFAAQIISQSHEKYCNRLEIVAAEIQKNQNEQGSGDGIYANDAELIKKIIAEGDYTYDTF